MLEKPAEANPHHVILVADPQLVDPHTYPSRPWPLSTLTVLHTDTYLRKSFAFIQRQLMPDTVLFLGDLFDGGREWSTPPSAAGASQSPDKRWNQYGDAFWLKEYNRFGRVFLQSWVQGRYHRPGQRGRRLIAELPGNHDLGFGLGIRLPVRQRFNAYFGEGNRVDMIGNFTFVLLDTVSLSANGQADPATGTQGADSGDEKVRRIWDPAEDFLSRVKEEKLRVINRELRLQAGLPETEPQDHRIDELDGYRPGEPAHRSHTNSSIPSILLTHVPLYRARGTPCGKLREKYPPSAPAREDDDVTQKDDRNALPYTYGVQYQTVLTPAITREIIEKVGDIEAVFSGDDHDYCEVTHRGYTSNNGGIKEITVKSISWAAGVRKPGFLMLSLWNPIDAQGNRIGVGGASADHAILETHLCLLPDQLSTFMRYGILLGATLTVLLAHAVIEVYGGSGPYHVDYRNLLPPKKTLSPPRGPETTSASVWSGSNGLAVRTGAVGRTRGAQQAGEDEWNEVCFDEEPKRRTKKSLRAVLRHWKSSLQRVAAVASVWYLWLQWTT